MIENKFPKIDIIDYVYFFVVIIYAAMAIPATKSMVRPEGSILAYIIPWCLCIFIAVKHKVSFNDKKLVTVLTIYLIWVILQTLKFHKFYRGSVVYLGDIIIAYIIIRIYDKKMFFLYEKIVAYLSVVALIGWILTIIASSPFTAFMKKISVYNFSNSNTIVANNIIFSLTNVTGRYRNYVLPRNSGFSWEPGRYAIMLVLAIFFNLIRTKFTLKKNKNFWILFIALLTTQSTTGYVAFLFVMYIYITNKNIKSKVILTVFILVPLVIGSFYLPFMGNKINNLWFNEQNIQSTINIAEFREKTNSDSALVPQRFTAILFELMNIQYTPLLGYGISSSNSYVQSKISPYIYMPGGAFKIISQFGLILAFLVYIQLYKSSQYLKEIYDYEGKWVLFVLFVLLSISYNLWDVPFFMSIWLFYIFRKKYVHINA